MSSIKMNIKSEDIQDLSKYTLDIQDELSSILSEELAKSIDKEIINVVIIKQKREERKIERKYKKRKGKIRKILLNT